MAEVIDHLGASGQAGIIDGTEIRVRRPATGRRDRDKFISGKNKQNAVKVMVLTDQNGRVLFWSPARPGSCADITHARRLGRVKLLADSPVVEILAQTGGRVVTPPHRKFKKRPGLVRGNTRTAAQGAFLQAGPRRARDCSPQEPGTSAATST